MKIEVYSFNPKEKRWNSIGKYNLTSAENDWVTKTYKYIHDYVKIINPEWRKNIEFLVHFDYGERMRIGIADSGFIYQIMEDKNALETKDKARIVGNGEV